MWALLLIEPRSCLNHLSSALPEVDRRTKRKRIVEAMAVSLEMHGLVWSIGQRPEGRLNMGVGVLPYQVDDIPQGDRYV